MEIVRSIKLLYGLSIKSSRKFYLLFAIDFPNLSLFFIYIFINCLTVVVKFCFCILLYQIVLRTTLLFGNEYFLLISSIVKIIHVCIFTFTSFKLIQCTDICTFRNYPRIFVNYLFIIKIFIYF